MDRSDPVDNTRVPQYEYVNLDDCWMSTERDANGDLQWDPVAFPTGHTLGDYVHSKGWAP